jgi:MFS family permease
MNEQRGEKSAWTPLKEPIFRALWIATVASNIGTWIQDVGAAWLMTSLAPSPLMVALVEVATTLPMFMLALPAGALADIFDRRRLLLITQGWMLAVAAGLSILTLLGITTPWLLLTFTFLLGLGAAMNAPAWQAIVPELVTIKEIPAAVALNSVGFNISRAIGPALGGLIVAAAGAYAAFILNAVTFLGVIVVLYRWRRKPSDSALPSERLFGAIRAGLRYVRQSVALRSVLVRSGVFIIFASAMWALMPLVARIELGRGPAGYGMLLTSFGVGAVLGATVLPAFRRRISIDTIVAGATILFALVLLSFAYLRIFSLLCAVTLVGGAMWLTLLSSFNTAVQASVPSWVRARALSVYLLVFFGGFAGASTVWGVTATHLGIPNTFVISSIGLALGLALTLRYRLIKFEGLDLSPTKRWPTPTVVEKVDLDHGPVLVTIEYRIDPTRSRDFARVMKAVSAIRLRDGAIRWNLFKDTEDPGRYLETFIVESWIEHLRQHERVTISDHEILDQALAYHTGNKPPIVSHFIAEPLTKYSGEESYDE